jgi:glycosyltransferase involved in cell wall biosynthesis
MKIAYVIINANRHEGTSRAILEVAERFAASHNVHLWSRTFSSEDCAKSGQVTGVSGVCRGPINWLRVPGIGRPEIADFGSFKFVTDRRLRNTDYDIIHCAGPNTAIADVYTIQTVHPVKVTNTLRIRDATSAGPFRRLSWRLYDSVVIRAEKESYTSIGPRGPRAFLPVSIGTRQELISSYPELAEVGRLGVGQKQPLSFDPVTVIPNGADLVKFHPRQRAKYRAIVREKHALKSDDFVVVFSGGDWRRKGLDLLIKTIELLRDQQIRLLVVGDDRNGKEIRDFVKCQNLSSIVTFAGFQSEVHRYYAAGDLFVFPTMYEAFSLATIEAAASGLPVVMSDASGAIDLLGDGDCGAIVARDPIVIADRIMEYRRDPALLARHGRNARIKAERDFSWDGIASKTLEVYEQLIDYRKFLAARGTVAKDG